MITRPTYCYREELKAALDVLETARSNDQMDRAISTATETVDACLKRTFLPRYDTRYFRWPDRPSPTPWRLWLEDSEVIDVTALTAGGATIAPADYFLEPANQGPPFTHIETDLASSAAFNAGTTTQRAIAVTGRFGYRDDEEPVGVLAGSLAGTIGATASVTWSTSRIGVGTLLRIDSEYILVTERGWSSSGQTLQTPLTAAANSVTVAVTDGTAFAAEELILLDAERMRIIDVAGNNLIVKRAWDGSVLATHSGSTVYAMTGVTLGRAQQGSTIAAHSGAAVINRAMPPDLVRDLALAEALTQVMQERAGYARVAGTAEYAKEVMGRGLIAIRAQALEAHGRQFRVAAV